MLTRYRIAAICTAILFALTTAASLYFSFPYYQMKSVVIVNQISTSYIAEVHARHIKSKNDEAFLIACDVGSDKAKLTPLVRELSERGYGVLIFDMPSEGLTDLYMPFNYKDEPEDILAHYFYNVYVAYTQLENISVDKVHIVGYGESARVILQTGCFGLLKAQTDAGETPIDLTLVAADINLTGRMDYDALNYRDDSQIDWINQIGPSSPGIPVNLITTKWDSISTVEDNSALLDKLQSGANPNTNADSLRILGFIPHGALFGSPQVIEAILQATVDSSFTASWAMRAKAPLKYLSMLFFVALLYFCGRVARYSLGTFNTTASIPDRKRVGSLFVNKLLMNLFGIIVDILLAIAIYYAPILFPYYRIFAIVILSGYGFVMLVLYRFTDFSNNLGSAIIIKDRNANPTVLIGTYIFVLGLCAFLLISFPDPALDLIAEPLWTCLLLFLFTPLFYVDEKERRVFADDWKLCLELFAANFIVLLLSPALLAALGMLDAAATMLSIIAFTLIAVSTELLTRPIGLSSFSAAVLKSGVLIMLAFSGMTMFPA